MPNYHKSRNRNRNKNKNRNNNNNSNNSNTDSNRQNRLNQNNSQQHLKDKEKCNVNEVESVEITTKATTQLPVSAESVSVVNVAIDETNERDDVTASNTIAHIGNEVQLLSKEPKPTIGTSGTVSFEHTKGNEAIVGYGQVKNEDPHENMGNNKSKEVEHIPMPSPVNEEAISNTSDILLESNLQKQPVEGKIIVHRVLYEEENEANNSIASNLGEQSNTQNSIDPPRKATVHRIHIDLEEDDEKPCDDECKEKITNRSQVEICEVNEDLITSDLPIVQSPIVTEVESESEELTKIESPDDAMKTSDHIFQYDDNLDTRQRSKQKKLAIQNHFLPHFLNPRYLDSITEENSDLSDYSDKVKAPLQSLKEPLKTKTLNFSNFMQETSTPLIVETRITETPGADESCSILECSQAVKPEAAETIFINSASSSITDLLDYENMETNSRTVHDADTVNISSKSQSEETPANKKTPTTTTTTMSDCIDDKQIVQTTENMIMRSPSPGNIENASANTNDLVATSVVLSSSEHMPTNPITERNENFENSVALISSSSNGCETLNSILSVDHKTKQQILFENEMNNVRALLISENSLNTNGNRSSDVLQNNNNSNSITTTLTKDSPPTPTLSLTTASESIAKLNSDPVPDRDSDSHLHENNCSAGKPINADTTKPNKSVTDAQSSISDVNGAACTLRQHGNASTNFYFTYPEKLRILCAEKLESLPYGHAVLEELAKISQNIGEVKAVTSIRQTSASSKDVKMPYPLPTMPHIKDLQLHLQSRKEGTNSLPLSKPEEKLHSQTWTGIPTNSDPKVLVCISPSQRSYMERHVEQQPDDLLSAHQKFIERRGYYEYTKNEIEAMEEEKRAEKDVLQMAAHMKKLRKSLTPTPPPIPPPPVPIKSMETSVKALNSMNQAITGDMKKATATNSRSSADSVNKEENIKHLLEILNNTNETKQKQILDVMSSLPENSSRQTNYKVDGNVNGMPGTPQTNANKHSQQLDHFNASDRYRGDSSSNMEIDFKLNPTYSETLPLNFESKSYSKMETSSSYEAKKRIENGKIVCDTSESKYDKRIETDSNNNNKKSNNNSNNERESSDSNFSKSEQNKTKTQTQTTDATNKVKEPIPPYGVEIMSDTKLNKISEITKETKNSTHSVALDWDYEKKMKSDAATDQEHRKTNVENEAQNLCKEFRQNAKTSDLLDRLNTKTSATTNEIKDQVTSQHTLSTSSSFTSDHEKLLKEFDELSRRLHNELETNTWQKRQRELSSSMFDLSALQMKQKQHFEEFKRRRHEHMKELENEIEKSIKSRQLKFAEKLQNGQVHNVPIRIEADEMKKDSSTFTDEKKGNNHEPGRVYQIPIKIENTQKDRQMHRSESMFNLGEEQHKGIHRPYANHMNQMDSNGNNWSKQRQDFGFSENISKPFAREVEICYQRQSPRVIRAPRLTDAPNESSLENNASTSHHSSKRFSAPMFTERQQPSHHASCYSMIERDPNPTYISTTTRRGVSPAPTQVSASQPDVSQRRDSLPKSFHDQKLKHLSDKENALRAEFEQLQNERRRLLEEIQTGESPSHSSSFNTMHETYRSMQKLPTLTENEVFRQQMAEEWLSKVAEREKRRLQKVVKISKISDNSETFNKSTSTLTSTGQASDMGSEFLKRVKERRSKLAIPADSDWESGAESQPINQNQTSEAEDVSAVKFIEGKAEAKPSQLPKHLREFAKFSTAQQDQLDGNDHKEHFEEEEQSSEITENSTSKALKKSWMTKTVKISRSSRDNGQDQKNGGNQPKPNLTTTRRKTSSKQKHAELTNTHNCKRLSWSESDLLNEIDKDLKLAKGFLFKDVYNVKHVYMSEPESINECPKKMAQLGRRLCDGIGPVTNDGMPIVLRSEVKEPHQHEWYKRLYQTIHKQKHGDDYLIRYKCPRGRKVQQYSGYQSEPEPAKDTDYSTIKYRTTNPQRLVSVSSNVNLRNTTSNNNSLHGLTSDPIKSGYGTYKNQPGRIENYITGHSSISEKEKKKWWDEVMDIFNNVQLDQTKLSSHANDGNLARALSLESGYTSDSNLVFRKKEATQSSPLGPIEQKIAYRNVQAGGEPPLYGFRKPAPEKPKVSPNLYHESDVSIYFKTPVCQEPRSPITDEELAARQAEYMQKLYQEERRRKYLQELQDMNARRHTDNFTPSQKSPIALNRYDDFPADLAPKSPLKQDLQTKAVARALYNFQGQNPRELCFKKGDIIYIRRTIDKNWYEGERNAMVGLFPANYVEIISRGEMQYLKQQTRQKPSEGQARAKYNFQAQSGIELSLNKGELVSLTRRVDENWFEGRIANRKGIFPVAYVEVLIDIGAEDVVTRTDRTTHRHMDTLRSNINQEFNTLIRHGYHTQTGTNSYFPKGASQKNKTDILHVDTTVEPIVYRALYKYQPQNSDELELFEGDLVHVLEKCDDGWYVGTSQRTGCFGTFPGNYVERI